VIDCLGLLILLTQFFLAVLLKHIALQQFWVLSLINSLALMLWKDVIELFRVELLSFLRLV